MQMAPGLPKAITAVLKSRLPLVSGDREPVSLPDFPGGSDSKVLPTMWETRVQSPGQEDLLEKEMVTHSSILAWKIPWTEKPGRLQSIAFLPRSKCLLISWLQSPSSVILEPKKIKAVPASAFPPSIGHEVVGPYFQGIYNLVVASFKK